MTFRFGAQWLNQLRHRVPPYETVRVIIFKKTTIIEQQQRVKRDVYASVGIAVSTFGLEVHNAHTFSKDVVSGGLLRSMRYPAGVAPAARDSGTSTTYAGGVMRQSSH